jgi:hypothetical protein
MKRYRPFLSLLATCLVCAATVNSFAQNPSTPEERARLTSLAQKLENSPLDPSLRPEREWAIKWLIEVPDIHVSMCPTILGDYHKYKYSPEITTQLMLAGARFSIENPDKAKDQVAQYMAGAESALKAYSAILQQDPKAKSKALDDDLQKKSQGKLKEYIEDAVAKSCRHES